MVCSRTHVRNLPGATSFAAVAVVESAGKEIRSMVSPPFWRLLPSPDKNNMYGVANATSKVSFLTFGHIILLGIIENLQLNCKNNRKISIFVMKYSECYKIIQKNGWTKIPGRGRGGGRFE